MCLEVDSKHLVWSVGISKHLVWCVIFEKCQNLGESNEMYHAATIQFSKNVQLPVLQLPSIYFCQ